MSKLGTRTQILHQRSTRVRFVCTRRRDKYRFLCPCSSRCVRRRIIAAMRRVGGCPRRFRRQIRRRIPVVIEGRGWRLDPFCRSGQSVLASVGFDLLPFGFRPGCLSFSGYVAAGAAQQLSSSRSTGQIERRHPMFVLRSDAT